VNNHLDAGIFSAHRIHMAGQKALMDGAMALPQKTRLAASFSFIWPPRL
jgi:hypothetical protein